MRKTTSSAWETGRSRADSVKNVETMGSLFDKQIIHQATKPIASMDPGPTFTRLSTAFEKGERFALERLDLAPGLREYLQTLQIADL